MNWRTKSAIVTGGGSGIGQACAVWLAERGVQVWSFDNNPLPTTLDLYRQLGVQSRLGDVRSEENVRHFVAEVASKHANIDILIHSAGVGCIGPITAITEEQWDRCLDINLKGAFLFAKHVIPTMTRGGVIVNIASNAGITPRVHDAVYCVSKAGLIMLTRALALAHAQQQIRVNAVCPGPVEDTRMMQGDVDLAVDKEAFRSAVIGASPIAAALGRMASSAEIAAAVGYLCSDEAVFCSGTILAIDGAKSVGVPPRSS